MTIQTITANFLKTICWNGNTIVDWSAGKQYFLNGEVKQFGYHLGWGDSAIISANGDYVFIYKKLGTKGLLLKNGQLIREIDRSYYCSGVYEYPAAFVTVGNKTFLVHCPAAYNQLDFEDVETGEIITNIKGRKPDDRFHSRLEVSPGGIYLMSKGWVWHPLDEITIFNISDCIDDPHLLDSPLFCPNLGVEICTASFIDDHKILVGASDELYDEEEVGELPKNNIAIWDFKNNQLSKPVPVKEAFGNLFAINDYLAWDLYIFPKIIDISTGEIIAQNKKINTGKQKSSIIGNDVHSPSIIFNKTTKQIAVKGKEKIKVLTPGLALK